MLACSRVTPPRSAGSKTPLNRAAESAEAWSVSPGPSGPGRRAGGCAWAGTAIPQINKSKEKIGVRLLRNSSSTFSLRPQTFDFEKLPIDRLRPESQNVCPHVQLEQS